MDQGGSDDSHHLRVSGQGPFDGRHRKRSGLAHGRLGLGDAAPGFPGHPARRTESLPVVSVVTDILETLTNFITPGSVFRCLQVLSEEFC